MYLLTDADLNLNPKQWLIKSPPSFLIMMLKLIPHTLIRNWIRKQLWYGCGVIMRNKDSGGKSTISRT